MICFHCITQNKNAKIWHTRCARWCNNYNLDNNLGNQSRQHLIYAKDMQKICPIHAQDMPKICPRYARNMPKIFQKCQIYAQNMPKISHKYVQDRPKICDRYNAIFCKISKTWMTHWLTLQHGSKRLVHLKRSQPQPEEQAVPLFRKTEQLEPQVGQVPW